MNVTPARDPAGRSGGAGRYSVLYNYNTTFILSIVVEVAFREVQESSQSPGGVTPRFARMKAYRPDMPTEEADGIDAVRALA